MLELQAAPSNATIRYSTSGSDPFVSGGTYNEPFEVAHASLVQVGAEKGGIRSEAKTLRTPDKEAGPYQPDLARPARWKKDVRKQSTAEVFGWMESATKHNITVSGLVVQLNSRSWVELSTDTDLPIPAAKLTAVLDFLKTELLPEGEVSISSAKLHFATGQALLDYVRDTKDEIKDGNEVEQ